MSIFDDYQSKEALLSDLQAAIVELQKDDGTVTYRLPNTAADTFRVKYEAEVKNAKNQREKKQEAEAKLAELTALRDKELVELQQLREMNPSDMKTTLQKYVDQTAESSAKIKELEKEIIPLREANRAYKERETRELIEAELVSQARKMNCCDSAMRDVKRLAPMFRIAENGIIMTDDNRFVPEVLEAEIEQSPHWLKRSQSGGSASGNATISSEARFREALKGSDFGAVLANAPREDVH